MRIVRSTLLFGLAAVLLGSLPPSCSTKAVGIDECRRIENARCEAAVACPGQFDIHSAKDVSACKRFYRDQCLHGLALSDAPGGPEVADCVETIGKLATCAKNSGEDSLISACGSLTSSDLEITTVCAALHRPQVTTECAFLVNTEEDGSGGNAGSSGSSGDGGTAGTTAGGAGGKSGT